MPLLIRMVQYYFEYPKHYNRIIAKTPCPLTGSELQYLENIQNSYFFPLAWRLFYNSAYSMVK